jgi:hypothetical protein
MERRALHSVPLPSKRARELAIKRKNTGLAEMTSPRRLLRSTVASWIPLRPTFNARCAGAMSRAALILYSTLANAMDQFGLYTMSALSIG